MAPGESRKVEKAVKVKEKKKKEPAFIEQKAADEELSARAAFLWAESVHTRTRIET